MWLLFDLLVNICPAVLHTAASFMHKMIIISFIFLLVRRQNMEHV